MGKNYNGSRIPPVKACCLKLPHEASGVGVKVYIGSKLPLIVDFRFELINSCNKCCPLGLMISIWKFDGVNDSWWLKTFRKTGSNSPITRHECLWTLCRG
jgi:hypothetical protein